MDAQCPPHGAGMFGFRTSSGSCCSPPSPFSVRFAARLSASCLIAIGAVQVLESRIGPKAAIALNLVLCYALMYFSEPWPAVSARDYWYILFLPVVSAASEFRPLGSAPSL